MKKVKRIALALALVCVMLVGVLGGCGAKFDAKGYLNALLDASYKGDSKAFVDMKIGTADEAAELYEQGIDAEMSAFLEGGVTISPELEAEFREIFKQMLGKVKYTVGDAEKGDDCYTVTITYEQMKIFEPVLTEYLADVEAMATEWAANPESAPSDDEMMEAILVSLKDSMKKNLENVQYAESATTTVRIELVDKVWTPNQRDIQNLEAVLFDTDAAQ